MVFVNYVNDISAFGATSGMLLKFVDDDSINHSTSNA